MAKRTFDLGSMMEAVSNLDTAAAAPEVRMIPLEDIIPNKANFYKIDKTALKPLADSIALDGLHHYPLVMPHPSKEGKYQLIDGERRYTAIKLLVEDPDHPREDLRLVPCTVRHYKSQAMAELQLILSNSTNRVLSNAETMKQAEKTEILFYQLKEEGYEFPGRMRDQVAAACKVSAPKLARLKVIREKLISDFMYLFEKDKLTEQAAYALARLPVEFQSRVSKVTGCKDIYGYGVEAVLKKYTEGWRWEPTLKCPDGKACTHGDAALRHDLSSSYNHCGGERCCLECSEAKRDWSPCERMCSKAKAQRKEKEDAEKAKEAGAAEKRAKAAQKKTRENALRLLPAIDASGLPDKATIRWEYSDVKIGDVRKWASGEFDGDSRSWWGEKLGPNQCQHPRETAKKLGCSADFLLGLTDVPGPKVSTAPAKQTARPLTNGDRIRRMDNKELAALLYSFEELEGMPEYCESSDDCASDHCSKCLLAWLEREEESENA